MAFRRARKVFEQLDEARKRGVVIRRPEFNYAMHAAGRNGGTDLGRLLGFAHPNLPAQASHRSEDRRPESLHAWRCRPAISPSESARPEQVRPILAMATGRLGAQAGKGQPHHPDASGR